MKRCPIMPVVLVVAGCVTSDIEQPALQELRTEVRGLGANLGDVEQSLSEVSSQIRRLERELDARLDNMETELARPVEVPAPICEYPEPLPAVAVEAVCEVPEEAVVEPGTDKMVVGSVERIRITPPGIDIIARIDTGADSNSLSAKNLVFLERDSKDWVRFDLPIADATHTLERRVIRFVRVFQQSDIEGTRRPVVLIRVRLGRISRNFEFNLSDRTHLQHPVILGRNLLTDLIVVDVAQEFVQPLPDGEG